MSNSLLFLNRVKGEEVGEGNWKKSVKGRIGKGVGRWKEKKRNDGYGSRERRGQWKVEEVQEREDSVMDSKERGSGSGIWEVIE